MSAAGAYGETIAEIVGAAAAPVLEPKIAVSSLAITRLSGAAPRAPTPPLPAEDAWIVAYQICGTPVDLWAAGRRVPIENGPGAAVFLDLSEEPTALLKGRFDSIHFYLPRAAQRAAAEADEVSEPQSLRPPTPEIYDPRIQAIGQALLPALNFPRYANRLFVDSMAVSFMDQLRLVCGHDRGRAGQIRGGIASWQERRACDLIRDNLAGDLSLTTLAKACGLSRSYFANAFAVSTGLPPHQWLMFARVARARELLAHSLSPLADVALSSGFVDQSHLTRVFSQATGMSPGRWRRIWRI